MILIALVAFELLLILLAPLFEYLQTAFLVAVSKLFALIDTVIPSVTIVGIVLYYYKKWNGRKKDDDNDNDDDGPTQEDIEYAAQEAEAYHDDLAELMYNVISSEDKHFKRPRDIFAIETGRDTPYRMDGAMAIHQFSADLKDGISLSKEDEEDTIRDLQRYVHQYRKRYSHLLKDGLPPIIYDLKNNGDFVLVEVVFYSKKYQKKIEDHQKARISCKNKREHFSPYIDGDYGE